MHYRRLLIIPPVGGVSVLLANYNNADTLEASVRSLTRQSHRTLEILILDDASTDMSWEMLQALAANEPRIRLFRSTVNRGVFWSFNYLMTQARYETITFQAADDVSHHHRIHTQLTMLQQTEKVASIIAFRRVNTKGQTLTINGKTRRYAYALMMFKKSAVLPVLGYFDTVRFGADTEWWERMQRAFAPCAFARLNVVLYDALFHEASLTQHGAGAHGWSKEGTRHYRSRGNALRAAYHAASRQWHQAQLAGSGSLRLDFPLQERPFPIPHENSVEMMEINSLI